MKTIAEMTLTELQDFARSLKSENDTLKEDAKTAASDYEELRKTNLLLQKQNNRLLMQVEQDASNPPAPAPAPDPTPEEPESPTLEEFALKNIKEIMN